MKSTTEYINILRDYMAKNASKYSITRIGIFGSVARGEQTENSDVDVFLQPFSLKERLCTGIIWQHSFAWLQLSTLCLWNKKVFSQ